MADYRELQEPAGPLVQVDHNGYVRPRDVTAVFSPVTDKTTIMFTSGKTLNVEGDLEQIMLYLAGKVRYSETQR